MRVSILSAVLFTASALAFPTEKRQSSTTCGSNYYSSSDVADALNQGYGYYSSNEEADSYPHTYNNYEGFDFPVSGPYQEFPIEESGVYNGGSPVPTALFLTPTASTLVLSPTPARLATTSLAARELRRCMCG